MSKEIITGLVVAGNVLAGNIVAVVTKLATNKFCKNKKTAGVINTVIPIASSVGIGAASSYLIVDAWGDTCGCNKHEDTTETTTTDTTGEVEIDNQEVAS